MARYGLLVWIPVTLFIFVRADDSFPIAEDDATFDELVKGTSSYRLPKVLDPIHYDVEMTPYFESTAVNEIYTFDGLVTIKVQAVENVSESFVIHENVREIVEVAVRNQNSEDLSLGYERITQYQFLQITLRPGVTLNKGENYTIYVKYIGNINETPLSRGVFRGYHRNIYTGQLHHYVATHLQPTHSRQALPCFDEPGFKSTFTIIVNRPCNFTDTYSNMPLKDSSECNTNNRVREVFYETPRMSAYLISIHISEQFTTIAHNLDSERPYSILARADSDGQGEWALDVGINITKWFEDFLGIPYYKMAENMKNDHLASPDWASGATENWGLVTYRESRLLYQEGETNAIDKMQIGTITAHELAHKWFGNLITTRWWDNVWVNEGFASYFEYFAMDGVHKELELEDQFNLFYLQNALSTDSSTNTRALQHEVNSPGEVSGHFTGISYSKGGSLLMMLNHFVTPSTFQKALRYFLLDRQYQYALPEHIYVAFAKAVEEDNVFANMDYKNITDFMQIWVNEPGYPVLNVKVNHNENKIDLEQERFILSAAPQDTRQIWPLPITIATKKRSNFENRRASMIMESKSITLNEDLDSDTWVVLNIKQSGIYRVNYDAKNWELLTEALNNKPEDIHYLNRAQIVDDIFAFMRSERMSVSDGFKVLQFLKKETNFYVWNPAITGLTFYRNRIVHLESKLAEFDKLLLEYLDAVIKDLGFDEGGNDNLIRIRNRFSIMSLACNVGHEGCLKHAVNTFNNFYINQESVNPNLRRHVYCWGINAGDYETWDYMRDYFIDINNQADEIVTLRSLGCTTNSRAINRYLELILTEAVRPQDRVSAFSYVYAGHKDNAKKTLEFIKSHHNQIRIAVYGSSRFNSVLSSLAGNLDEKGLADMENWLTNNQHVIPEYNAGINAIGSARKNMEWGAANADDILKAMRGSAAALIPTTVSLLTAIVMFLLK